jgi:hypothetical protein
MGSHEVTPTHRHAHDDTRRYDARAHPRTLFFPAAAGPVEADKTGSGPKERAVRRSLGAAARRVGVTTCSGHPTTTHTAAPGTQLPAHCVRGAESNQIPALHTQLAQPPPPHPTPTPPHRGKKPTHAASSTRAAHTQPDAQPHTRRATLHTRTGCIPEHTAVPLLAGSGAHWRRQGAPCLREVHHRVRQRGALGAGGSGRCPTCS